MAEANWMRCEAWTQNEVQGSEEDEVKMEK